MMSQILRIVLPVAVLAVPLFAQSWEAGAVGGYGFHTKKSVTAGSSSGDVGFKEGFAAGAILGQDMASRIGGELRYMYQKNDLLLESGGREVTFGGESHMIHYNFLFYLASREATVRPFVSVGGGVKVFRGTGATQIAQPLANLALLSPVTETKGLGVVGGGVKFKLSEGVVIRAEVHDYITPFPKQVIAPSVGAKISGIVHNIVPTIGITAVFD
jgi:hypothetical protein